MPDDLTTGHSIFNFSTKKNISSGITLGLSLECNGKSTHSIVSTDKKLGEKEAIINDNIFKIYKRNTHIYIYIQI